MNYETFEKKISRLNSTNPTLVEAYELSRGERFEENYHDLYMLFDNLSKIHSSADPVISVATAMSDAVQSHCSILDSFQSLISKAQLSGMEKSSLQQYFHEISAVYEKNNNDYNIEYCPENIDRLIEMNLKTVISIAKGYQGLGLSLEELISAGNMGLVVCAKGDEKTHIPKYDPHRAKLKEDMLSTINELPDDATEPMIIEKIRQYMTYGDIKKKFLREFAVVEKKQPRKIIDLVDDDETEDVIDNIKGEHEDIKILSWTSFTKEDVVRWIKRNVKNATFNSVAFLWIRAYILIAIDTESRLVKKPKSEIYNDKLKYGAYKKEVTLDIDAPVNDDSNTNLGDILQLEDDTPNEMEISEAYDVFKDELNKLLDGVKPRDRSVFLKKFGIGLPRPMLPKEIAEQENLSIARISQIFQNVVEQMQKNQAKYNIDPDILFEAAKKLD